jgi:tetratricopeptide (TPR) repeat protein
LREALTDFARVLELDAGQTRAFFLRSLVHKQLGDTAAAEADFREGLKREPTDDRSWNARGHAHLERGEPEEAEKCFRCGLQVHPRSFSNLTSLAEVLADRLNRPEEALEIADRVVELFPDYDFAHSDRGILRARLNRRDAAREDAARALRRGNGAELHYRVACIYAQTSRQDARDAKEAFPLLFDALKRGFGANLLPRDPDLEPLHSDESFRRLSGLARDLTTPLRN